MARRCRRPPCGRHGPVARKARLYGPPPFVKTGVVGVRIVTARLYPALQLGYHYPLALMECARRLLFSYAALAARAPVRSVDVGPTDAPSLPVFAIVGRSILLCSVPRRAVTAQFMVAGSRARIAQACRALRWANATQATLKPRRATNARSQRLCASCLSPSRLTTARAPWINSCRT